MGNKLSKFRIIYEQRKAIKAQAPAEFVVEMTKVEDEQLAQWAWTLYVDRLSNGKHNGARVILEGPNNMMLEYSLKFNFNATNNQAKYEVLVIDL